MADVNINILVKDANVNKVRDAILDKFPKPDNFTATQWMKQVLRDYVRRIVIEHDEKLALQSATTQAQALIDTAKSSVSVPDNITE